MVEPKLMCRQHLLGEHLELHMFVGSLKRGIKLDGFVDSNCLEIIKLESRHDDIVSEMTRRGYSHNSPLPSIDKDWLANQSDRVISSRVDAEESLKLLLSRCSDCAMEGV
jgi:hypothetical protein